MREHGDVRLRERLVTPCPACHRPRDERGRWPDPERWPGATYCSNACKQRAYRRRAVTAPADAGTPGVTEKKRNRCGNRHDFLADCAVCRLGFPDGAAILYAQQLSGEGPYPGQPGWYVATVHADPCGRDFLAAVGRDYRERPCRGCGRTMWLRARSRRTHCSDRCRHVDYQRRREAAEKALAAGDVIYRDDLYWLTRPDAVFDQGGEQ